MQAIETQNLSIAIEQRQDTENNYAKNKRSIGVSDSISQHSCRKKLTGVNNV